MLSYDISKIPYFFQRITRNVSSPELHTTSSLHDRREMFKLHLAVDRKDRDVAELLIQSGADVNEKDWVNII